MKFYRVTLTRTTLRLNRRTGGQDPRFKTASFLLRLDDGTIPHAPPGTPWPVSLKRRAPKASAWTKARKPPTPAPEPKPKRPLLSKPPATG